MVRWLNAISYVIFPNLSVYIKWTEWYMFNFLVFLYFFLFKTKKGVGGNLGWRITIKYVPYPRTRSSRVYSCGDHCQPPYCVQWFYQYSLTKSVSWKYKYLLYKSEDNGSNWVVNIPPWVKIKDDRISSKHYFLTWI